MNKNMMRLWLPISIAAALSACARTPVPELAVTDVPDAWTGPVDSDAALWPNVDWWTNFESAELSALIELVKANNFDYANNIRNLEAAQIQLREAGFQLWPTPNVAVNTGASTSETRWPSSRARVTASSASMHEVWTR